MNRRRQLLLALPGVTLAGGAVAQERVQARQNIEYRLIEPPLTPAGTDRIEVIDFFWYGCPFCNQFLPFMDEWIRTKPGDVVVRRMPAILRENWTPHARIFFALQLLNEVERLHARVFHSYHVEELSMSKPDVMEQWAIRSGIDGARWREAYFSPAIDGLLADASRATRAYAVEGTPSLAVDGRFITSGSMAPSIKGMLPVLDDLIRLARQRTRK